MKKILLAMATIAILAGCTSDGNLVAQDDIRSVEWYKAHPEERTAQRKKCVADPKLATHANCRNADVAAFSTTSGRTQATF